MYVYVYMIYVYIVIKYIHIYIYSLYTRNTYIHVYIYTSATHIRICILIYILSVYTSHRQDDAANSTYHLILITSLQ